MVKKNYNDIEALDDEDIYGEGVFDTMKNVYNKTVEKVGDYASTVLHGRNDYPPKVRELIKIYGDKRITRITIDRTPVPSVLTSALNAVSMGAFKERFDKLPYDKLFHLRMDLTLADNTRLAVEKNEVINMYLKPKKLKGAEQIDVTFRESDITLNKLLAGGQSIQKAKWFGYSASSNNCQDFILALLNGSQLGNEQDRQFVKQDTSTLFKGDSFLRKFSNTVTDLGAKVNEITTGTGIGDDESCIQSIVFDKNSWTTKKAIKWLTKHNYTGLDVDEKPNTLRFRQIEPSDIFTYITKSLPNEIELVIAYKHKKVSNNNMNKKITGRGGGASTARVAPERLSHDEIVQRREQENRDLMEEYTNVMNAMRYAGTPQTIQRNYENDFRAELGIIRRRRRRENMNMTPPVSENEDEERSPEPTRGRGCGDLVHIDIGSHNAKGNIKGEGINLSLMQLINNYKKKEDEDLMKNMKQFYKDRNAEIAALEKKVKALPKYGKPLSGEGFKKGSPEAKEHMARIRAMRKTK
jgi:hypothetical protein